MAIFLSNAVEISALGNTSPVNPARFYLLFINFAQLEL